MPKGPLGRLGRFIRKIAGIGKPEPARGPPASPPPESSPPQRRRPPRDRVPVPLETRYQEAYRQITGTSTGYLDWYELFESYEYMFDNDDEKVRYWRMFLRSFYLTTHEKGHVKRKTFYNQTGIPESQIDWGQWRDLRRGTP